MHVILWMHSMCSNPILSKRRAFVWPLSVRREAATVGYDPFSQIVSMCKRLRFTAILMRLRHYRSSARFRSTGIVNQISSKNSNGLPVSTNIGIINVAAISASCLSHVGHSSRRTIVAFNRSPIYHRKTASNVQRRRTGRCGCVETSLCASTNIRPNSFDAESHDRTHSRNAA